MKHVDPKTLWLPERKIIRPQAFIPGISPPAKFVGAQREIIPGSLTWSTPGTYYWSVPLFNNLYIRCNGAGGGGSGAGFCTTDYWYSNLYGVRSGAAYTGGAGSQGGNGQITIPGGILSMSATGGYGGPAGSICNQNGQTTLPMVAGANGQGVGGNTSNYGANGSGGGAYGYDYVTDNNPMITYLAITWPPGNFAAYIYGGYGGQGGSCESRFTFGQIQQGLVATVLVQAGGAPGWQYTNSGGAYPVAGAAASVHVEWN